MIIVTFGDMVVDKAEAVCIFGVVWLRRFHIDI